MLVEHGYTALALDMYGEGKQATNLDKARQYSSEVMQDQDLARTRFEAALTLLRQHPTTDPEQLAAIGYCFGGAVVLQMARAGVPLQGVVSFHGLLDTPKPAQTGAVQAQILVCHAAEDAFVPFEQVQAFIQKMQQEKVYFQFISYPEAQHGFTNQEATNYAQIFKLPIGYNAAADIQSWSDMLLFLRSVF